MRKISIFIVLAINASIVIGQYNYGLEICDQDVSITGKLNLNDIGDNIFIGHEAGINITGTDNIFIGPEAGKFKTTGYSNIFIGNVSGRLSASCNNNIFMGVQTGQHNTGFQNIFLGHYSGGLNQSGMRNTFIGQRAGGSSQTGSSNTYIGFFSGLRASGSSNVFIGNQSGENASGSNKLYIENSDSDEPLIYGEFDTDKVQINGSLNITDVLNLVPQAPQTGACASNGDLVYGTDDELYLCKGNIWKKVMTN